MVCWIIHALAKCSLVEWCERLDEARLIGKNPTYWPWSSAAYNCLESSESFSFWSQHFFNFFPYNFRTKFSNFVIISQLSQRLSGPLLGQWCIKKIFSQISCFVKRISFALEIFFHSSKIQYRKCLFVTHFVQSANAILKQINSCLEIIVNKSYFWGF